MSVYAIPVTIFDEYAANLDVVWLAAIAQTTLSLEGVEKSASASVVIADDETVAELNSEHRGLDAATDVLSFSPTHSGAYYGSDERDDGAVAFDFILPPDHEDTNIGEIIISFPQARRQAAESGHSTANEIAALLAHGIYHLLGYDHEEEADAQRMRPRERAALDAIRNAGLIQ